jgi:hypothetical protein
MPMPDNTLPMMTGFGQFGPIEMGGMFTLMKIRDDLASNDYRDPGPYKNPEGQSRANSTAMRVRGRCETRLRRWRQPIITRKPS